MVWLRDSTRPFRQCWSNTFRRRRLGRIILTLAYNYAYNTAQHESTKFTPFELMFSRKPVLPIDIDRNAPEQIQESTEITEG